MTDHDHRRSTGDPDLDRRLVELLDAAGARTNRDQFLEILVAFTELVGGGASRLDVKIANAALHEMVHAFNVFAPYRETPKLTIFGSARVLEDDPMYVQARDLAAEVASQGWMVVTGAGPGIMLAGMEGAGRERSFGVNIRLPFEQGANAVIASDPKLVEMRYFFTRKLMLVKEMDGFVVMPGGFGTLDEAFELLTLLQTGKAPPAPLVMLDVPGGTYWRAWEHFLTEEVIPRGLISEEDRSLYCITDDVATAVNEVLGFYRNYHSCRYVGQELVMRLKAPPTDDEVADLQARFGDVATDGVLRRTEALPAERRDHPALPRLALRFDLLHHGRLRDLIDAVNALDSAPPVPTAPPRPDELDVD